ncbi:MAG: phosphatase PAP2 family protein [Lachnospiraceae bacterium]|nr:phosphatase PAP2 family protein [Lachnospiraceae bacterium]
MTDKNNSKISNYMVSAITFALFIILIILVKTVDVAAIGPAGTKIGLSGVNSAVHELFGLNMVWYDITKYLGAFAILVALGFVGMGMWQLISRKSVAKVDREILTLGGLYAVVVALYALFEVVIINYRPVIMPDSTNPEASFPSSHTMLICVVIGSAVMLTDKYIKNDRLCLLLKALGYAIIIITVIGRLICGVHWLTDIIGGVLISISLLSLYSSLIRK